MLGCDSYRLWSRRDALAGAAVFGLSALAGASFASRPDGEILVVIFLRGGWDGLTVVAPTEDPLYRRARPTLGIGERAGLDLGDGFRLTPALDALRPVRDAGRLAILHAVGSGDGTRSHFEAMTAMERGANREGEGPPGGWIARHLLSTPGDAPLRAVAVGSLLPDSFRGGPAPVLLERVEDYRLDISDGFLGELRALHADASPLAAAGRRTLDALDSVRTLKADPSFPDSGLGRGLSQVSALAKARVGLEIATLDLGLWDTHAGQGPWMSRLLGELGEALSAFDRSLGEARSRVTTVVMSEFGRRIEENAALGTDHGRGTAMLVMGEGLRSTGVLGRWPGLRPEDRDGPGDLRVTTDYRSILSELVGRRLGGRPEAVFPGFAASSGVVLA